VVAAGESVVRVLGTACGLGLEGSGWMAAPDLVVTNAHVVAGEDDTTVSTQGGATFDASPVVYDSDNDLAILRIRARLPTLTLAPNLSRGQSAAVLGYPDNGPYTVTPARIGESRDVISEDSYGRGPIRRTITSLRGTVRSGNSGGPVVDTRGRVLGTVFASTTGGRPGGFAIPDEFVESALDHLGGEVDTGACTG
jgi:S1-C subfamily serine protease